MCCVNHPPLLWKMKLQMLTIMSLLTTTEHKGDHCNCFICFSYQQTRTMKTWRVKGGVAPELTERAWWRKPFPQDSEEFFIVERDVDLAIYKMDRNVKECESGYTGCRLEKDISVSVQKVTLKRFLDQCFKKECKPVDRRGQDELTHSCQSLPLRDETLVSKPSPDR